MNGMPFNNMNNTGGGYNTTLVVNTGTVQEMTVTTSGLAAEARSSGVLTNIIPKEGGNSYRGSLVREFFEREPAGQQPDAGSHRQEPEGGQQREEAVGSQSRCWADRSSRTSSGSSAASVTTAPRATSPTCSPTSGLGHRSTARPPRGACTATRLIRRPSFRTRRI